MARGCDMGSSNFGQLLGDIPSMVSCRIYSNMENGRFPRFPTIFKLIKEDLKNEGYSFDTFTVEFPQNDVSEPLYDFGTLTVVIDEPSNIEEQLFGSVNPS